MKTEVQGPKSKVQGLKAKSGVLGLESKVRRQEAGGESPSGLGEAEINHVWSLVDRSIKELISVRVIVAQSGLYHDPAEELTNARKCLSNVWVNCQEIMEIMGGVMRDGE